MNRCIYHGYKTEPGMCGNPIRGCKKRRVIQSGFLCTAPDGMIDDAYLDRLREDANNYNNTQGRRFL